MINLDVVYLVGLMGKDEKSVEEKNRYMVSFNKKVAKFLYDNWFNAFALGLCYKNFLTACPRGSEKVMNIFKTRLETLGGEAL